MKIRTGFVSNSSSSSFVILGFQTNEEDVVRILLENYTNKKDLDEYYKTEDYLPEIVNHFSKYTLTLKEVYEEDEPRLILGYDIDVENSNSYNINKLTQRLIELQNTISEDKKIELITGGRL